MFGIGVISNILRLMLLGVRQACDYLAIGIHEVASMSERRIERLVNPAYSELPAFLTDNGGLNSGFMIAHCTAAALGIIASKHSRALFHRTLDLYATIKSYCMYDVCSVGE